MICDNSDLILFFFQIDLWLKFHSKDTRVLLVVRDFYFDLLHLYCLK